MCWVIATDPPIHRPRARGQVPGRLNTIHLLRARKVGRYLAAGTSPDYARQQRVDLRSRPARCRPLLRSVQRASVVELGRAEALARMRDQRRPSRWESPRPCENDFRE
jgi:hypothetical protein